MDEQYLAHNTMQQINTILDSINNATVAVANSMHTLSSIMSNLHMMIHTLADDSDDGPVYIDTGDDDEPLN